MLFATTGWDGRVSSWAVAHTPVFGSPTSARDASDALRRVGNVEMFATALLSPYPGGGGSRGWNGPSSTRRG